MQQPKEQVKFSVRVLPYGFICVLAIQNVFEEAKHSEHAKYEERDDGVLSTHGDDACTHGGHNDDESDDDGSLHLMISF